MDIMSIIEIIIGWFVLEKMPSVVDAKGTLATIIKIVGVLILIHGLIAFVVSILHI